MATFSNRFSKVRLLLAVVSAVSLTLGATPRVYAQDVPTPTPPADGGEFEGAPEPTPDAEVVPEPTEDVLPEDTDPTTPTELPDDGTIPTDEVITDPDTGTEDAVDPAPTESPETGEEAELPGEETESPAGEVADDPVEPTTDEAIGDEPIMDEPITDEPADEPIMDEPIMDEPIMDEPIMDEETDATEDTDETTAPTNSPRGLW